MFKSFVKTAAIVVFEFSTAFCISSPLTAITFNASLKFKYPDKHKAVYSPSECPIRAAGLPKLFIASIP